MEYVLLFWNAVMYRKYTRITIKVIAMGMKKKMI